MMFHRRERKVESYDREHWTPVIRSSICTGEKAAGFRENGTGRFQEIMLIRFPADLAEFKARYGIQGDVETIY